MAKNKRIKDKRKRKGILSLGTDPMLKAMHFKLCQVFPNKEERLNYIRTLIKDFNKPSNPVLVEGKYPELERN